MTTSLSLQNFLEQGKKKEFWETKPVFFLKTSDSFELTSLFLWKFLSSQAWHQPARIEACNLHLLQAPSFIFPPPVYIFSQAPEKNFPSSIFYSLIIISSEAAFAKQLPSRHLQVDCSFPATLPLAKELALALGYQPSPEKDKLLASLFPTWKKVDDVYRYVLYTSNTSHRYCPDIFHYCQGEELSPALFELSKAFFSKTASRFFELHASFTTHYPPLFFVSYWGDQWWRAFHYISAMREGKAEAAKIAGQRLPFSFLKEGWKKYSPEHFKTLLYLLCHVDYRFKQGYSNLWIDVLYQHHFSGLSMCHSPYKTRV